MPCPDTIAPLTSEDRAFMLYVAKRDFERGRCTPEEYHSILRRVHCQPSWLRTVLTRLSEFFLSAPTRLGQHGPSKQPDMAG